MDCELDESVLRSSLRARSAQELFVALGYEPVGVDVPPEALSAWGWNGEAVDGLRVIASAHGLRVVELRNAATAIRRSLALSVHRRNPMEAVLWVWHDPDELTLGIVATSAGGTSGASLKTTTLDREMPDPTGLERIRRLRLADVAQPSERDQGRAIREHLLEVLDQEALTRAFFRGFRDALQLLQLELRDGPGRSADRAVHDVSLVTLLRLVFLYFLQRERFLDGDRRYLVRRLRECIDSKESFWQTVLHPLFFGVLNTPVDRRDAVAKGLGEIPFLNGGLFEPSEAELCCPQRSWPNEVWQRVIEGLLERYHFTAVEPSGDDEASVVDPEMLGKVFEGLMYGDDRGRSGSFYTPRDVVRGMVDEVLEAYLTDFEEPRTALERVRILDPAVGTGAFLLEALSAIRERREALGLPNDYASMRRLVHDHLFGVDRDRTAVRLCELRLWLAMLAAMREELRDGDGALAPLPNLTHRIAAGDSLLAMSDVGRFRDRDGLVIDSASRERHRELERHLAALQREFLESHSEQKQEVRASMDKAERALQEQLLISRKAQLLRRLEPLRSVVDSDDLFGEPMATPDQVALRTQLEERVGALNAALDSVRAGRTAEAAFAYEARFGQAAREGFDIIVTNPPWVRSLRLDPVTKSSLKARYETASNELWPGASALGIRAPFGTQPDLAALFVERSLELLRPGGRLCALVPAKLFRCLHGSPLRRLLARHSVERFEDLSDSDRQLFDATTYPAILRVRKCEPSEEPAEIVLWRGARRERFRRQPRALSAARIAGSPWILVPDEVRRVVDRIWQTCVPLGAVDGFVPRRGIFTGANDVFVRPHGEFERMLGRDAAAVVRPVLTGSGLGEAPELEILWPYDEQGVLYDDVPDAVREYFEVHSTHLRGRSDFDARLPLWQAYRVRPDTLGPKVAWRDFSVFLEPVAVSPGAVPLNTVYYVACDDELQARGFSRWMGSLPVRAYAYALAERARGGWRRHFAWVVRMLPVPRAWVDGDRRGDPREAFGLNAAEIATLERWLEPQTGDLREVA